MFLEPSLYLGSNNYENWKLREGAISNLIEHPIQVILDIQYKYSLFYLIEHPIQVIVVIQYKYTISNLIEHPYTGYTRYTYSTNIQYPT